MVKPTQHDFEWYAAEAGVQDAMQGAVPCPELWAGEMLTQAFCDAYHRAYKETKKMKEELDAQQD